ncbi:MAG TPA: DUF3151 domain-containing protein [Acidimicrobiia bacterium]|nr:DUF3151 domain-containing protein [Acidimicrobiia bacterium]
MAEHPVELTPSGPSETVLPPAPPEARGGLAEAATLPPAEGRQALAEVAARFPRLSEAWAALGEASDGIQAYAFFRVGYHRGLDALRASGWRGDGYVRWRHEENRGFLRCLEGLRRMAAEIGEDDEAARCAEFLRQLDPEWGSRSSST